MSNILDHKINLSKWKENANFNEYNIIEKKINIEDVKCFKTITGYYSYTYSPLF